MTREWKPGDVAMVTIPGREERQMVRYDTGGERGWYLGAGGAFTDGKAHYSDDGSGRDRQVRPLVVIDPEDREQVRALMYALWDADAAFLGIRTTGRWNEILGTALRSLLAPPEPPKPDEPTGWGAVVEDNSGAYWTLIAPEAGAWRNYAEGARVWSEIAAVRVLSPGVTA